MSLNTTPPKPEPEAQELGPKPGTSFPGTESMDRPQFPVDRWRLLAELEVNPRASELLERLRPILAKSADMDVKGRMLPGTPAESARAEDCFREMQLAWDDWREAREFLGSWPPHFDSLNLGLQPWISRYQIREAEERLKPATRPEDDWRLQVCHWCLEPEDSRGPRPTIPRWEMPCTTIPTWEEGRTWLTLLPAPFQSPPYLPAVIDLGAVGPLLGPPLRLKQGSMMMEAEPISIGLMPPEGSRTWLLRLAHLSRAAWIQMI